MKPSNLPRNSRRPTRLYFSTASWMPPTNPSKLDRVLVAFASFLSRFDFAFEYTDRRATHFGNQSSAFCRDFHLYLAGTAHFDSLSDSQSFTRAQLPVLHQVSSK